jgi:hypothetical protein
VYRLLKRVEREGEDALVCEEDHGSPGGETCWQGAALQMLVYTEIERWQTCQIN